MNRKQRIGIIIGILTNNPNKKFNLEYFCNKLGASRSSISEDIEEISEIFKLSELGFLKTKVGNNGGITYIPDIAINEVKNIQKSLSDDLNQKFRNLDGGFLYTSDIMFSPNHVKDMALIFAKLFKNSGASFIATIETKGIPLALMTGYLLNLPLIVIRRESKISEGATVSINYISGNQSRIQKMSISKKSQFLKGYGIVIDDFMRGGGSVKGITEILKEVDCKVLNVGIAISNETPKIKKIDQYKSILFSKKDIKTNQLIVYPNDELFKNI